MTITLNQIERVIKREPISHDEIDNHIQGAVLYFENEAINQISDEVKKTQHYFSKNDWRKVYKKIKELIS